MLKLQWNRFVTCNDPSCNDCADMAIATLGPYYLHIENGGPRGIDVQLIHMPDATIEPFTAETPRKYQLQAQAQEGILGLMLKLLERKGMGAADVFHGFHPDIQATAAAALAEAWGLALPAAESVGKVLDDADAMAKLINQWRSEGLGSDARKA